MGKMIRANPKVLQKYKELCVSRSKYITREIDAFMKKEIAKYKWGRGEKI